MGRTRVKGLRLPTLKTLLDCPDTRWMSAALAWYDGVTRTVEFSSQTALWYHTGKPPVAIRWVLIRDPLKQFDSQALLCTDAAVVPVQIIEWFVLRWQIEVTFQEARAHLGVETVNASGRTRHSPTTPILLGLFSWITLAAHMLGNQCLGTPRSAAWYAKSEPTFVDAIALVRRHLWRCFSDFLHVASKPGYATNPDAAVQQVHRIASLCSLNVQSLSDVIHKAFVAVDEEGTEAAAATAVTAIPVSGAPGPPVEVTVDRPFIFLIRDGETGTILFVGRVLDPSG